MTPKQKAIVAVSAVVILAGAGFLYYEFVYKPKHGNKKAPEPEKTPAPSTTSNTPAPPPVSDKPVSQYGFKPGDMLFSKTDVTNVYSYPEGTAKYRLGFIRKGATSQAKFIADSSTPGFVKANAVYFTVDGTQKKIGDVYIPAAQVTNVAP